MRDLMEALGLLLTLIGFIFGLGAVTVIDFHSLFAIRSPYWMEATIRTHKITKPLIWIGLFTASLGSFLLYRNIGFTGYVPLQLGLAVILLVNGLILTFWTSPMLVRREAVGRSRELLPKNIGTINFICFVISFVCWWTELILFALYLSQN